MAIIPSSTRVVTTTEQVHHSKRPFSCTLINISLSLSLSLSPLSLLLSLSLGAFISYSLQCMLSIAARPVSNTHILYHDFDVLRMALCHSRSHSIFMLHYMDRAICDVVVRAVGHSEAWILRLRSTCGTPCVSEPSEMTSTQSDMYSPSVSSVMPPEASIKKFVGVSRDGCTIVRKSRAAASSAAGGMLSSITTSAPALMASTASSRFWHSTSIFNENP